MLISPLKISSLLKQISGGGADSNNENISGSFRNEPIQQMMRSIPKHLRKTFYFYDIGASTGYVLFCALAFSFKKARGCELPQNKAVHQPIFKSARRALGKTLQKKLDAKIIYNAFHHIPSAANVVYVFNAVFNPDLTKKIMAKVKKSNAQYFICTKSRSFSNKKKILDALEQKFKLVKEIKGYMIGSGTQHRVYVLKRL